MRSTAARSTGLAEDTACCSSTRRAKRSRKERRERGRERRRDVLNFCGLMAAGGGISPGAAVSGTPRTPATAGGSEESERKRQQPLSRRSSDNAAGPFFYSLVFCFLPSFQRSFRTDPYAISWHTRTKVTLRKYGVLALSFQSTDYTMRLILSFLAPKFGAHHVSASVSPSCRRRHRQQHARAATCARA